MTDNCKKKKQIIETAKKLIKNDIMTIVSSDKDHYPTTDELKIDACLSYLPKSLKDALDLMFSGKDTRRKVASIGQAIIQVTRPRSVLTPLQIGLGVQIHSIAAQSS